MAVKRDSRSVKVLTIVLFGIIGFAIATGIAVVVSLATDLGATRAANSGSRIRPLVLEPIQDAHESVSSVVALFLLAGGAWLMVRVKEDFSGLLAFAMLMALVASVSGQFLRFNAVQVGGEFVENLRSWQFLFDPDLELVTFGDRERGPVGYRLWFAVHVGSSLAMLAATARGVLEIRRGPGYVKGG